ncbi:MAG: pseudouridine synthase [Comamonadaceae bacterium]|jgi:tRNA pseudouridine32 synthase/23S rRNA pseudouridine746 synthase|nr:pseudouridine synthase [Comamonadaceae bacterium]
MSRPPKPALPLRDGVGASALFCPPGPWATLAEFLAQRLPRVSDWAERIARGEVVDEAGRPAGEAYRPQRRVFYWRRLEAEPEIPFEARIVFQDEHLLVADKPHFLPVTPGGAYVQQTLLTRLRRATGLAELSPIHRLDRETAGLVVFSLRAAERGAYQALFRDRAVDKVYEAVAPAGAGPWPRVLTHRLVEREGEAFMQMQAVDGAPNAETWVDLVEAVGAGLARYELRPRSGVKHQLRAQMSAIGLPLVGDRIYPRLQPQELPPRFDAPLQLLARAIAFTDPVTGLPRRFERAALTIAPS